MGGDAFVNIVAGILNLNNYKMWQNGIYRSWRGVIGQWPSENSGAGRTACFANQQHDVQILSTGKFRKLH